MSAGSQPSITAVLGQPHERVDVEVEASIDARGITRGLFRLQQPGTELQLQEVGRVRACGRTLGADPRLALALQRREGALLVPPREGRACTRRTEHVN